MTADTLTAVVTGAASGIGQALAEALHARGAQLVLADVAEDALSATAERLGATGVVADVSDPGAMQALAESVPDANLICLNAGRLGASLGAPWEVPAEEWDRVFAVNVSGVVNGLRAFVPRLLAVGRPAHVLITASLAGLAVFPGGGAYGPSKHAVTAIAQHAAMALADTPVGVSMICPALVSTGMSAEESLRPWSPTTRCGRSMAAPSPTSPPTGGRPSSPRSARSSPASSPHHLSQLRPDATSGLYHRQRRRLGRAPPTPPDSSGATRRRPRSFMVVCLTRAFPIEKRVPMPESDSGHPERAELTEFSSWLRGNAVRLDTLDPDARLDDLEPLREIVGDARVVAVGESAHFVQEFFEHANAFCVSSSTLWLLRLRVRVRLQRGVRTRPLGARRRRRIRSGKGEPSGDCLGSR